MDQLLFEYLRACGEQVRCQQELAPLLARHLGLEPARLYHGWWNRHFPTVVETDEEPWRIQGGEIAGTEWRYFFHGLECDLYHADGRHVRLEFGPRGRLDVLSAYSVLQFVMASRASWEEFAELKEYLAGKPPPYDRFSGSYSNSMGLWAALEEGGFVEFADPELARFVEEHTVAGPDGKLRWALPDDLPDDRQMDCSVSSRHVLSERAWRLLRSRS